MTVHANPKVLDTTPYSARVAWEAPPCHGVPVQGYSVHVWHVADALPCFELEVARHWVHPDGDFVFDLPTPSHTAVQLAGGVAGEGPAMRELPAAADCLEVQLMDLCEHQRYRVAVVAHSEAGPSEAPAGAEFVTLPHNPIPYQMITSYLKHVQENSLCEGPVKDDTPDEEVSVLQQLSARRPQAAFTVARLGGVAVATMALQRFVIPSPSLALPSLIPSLRDT